ncbi:MAG: hypothetical protein HKN75_11730, partial [Bacteroidia bacterium]|nr:hypothetical protein [Bacteroidia bacterium]
MKVAKAILFVGLFCFLGLENYAQNVGIGNAAFTPNASSMLEIQSNSNKGLLIPRVTNAQRNAMNPLPQAAQGLLVYQTNVAGASLQGFYYNTSTTVVPNWVYLSTGNNWSLTGNSAAFTDFLGTTNNMQLAFRTNNAQRMVISSTGFVGIGVPFPFATLHVNGTIRFQNLAGLGNRPVMTDAAGNLFAGAAGSGGWQTTGNAGTFSTNFIGTTDNQSFKIRTNNLQRAVVLNNGQFLVGTTFSLGNYLFQSKANSTHLTAVYGESINSNGSYGVYGKGLTNGIGVYGLGGSVRPGVLGAVT